jgi:hypothetical protein
MPDDDLDPAANTQMFQAFVDRREPEEASGSRAKMALLIAVAALVVVVAAAWFMMGR